jgi:hypothetical protein
MGNYLEYDQTYTFRKEPVSKINAATSSPKRKEKEKQETIQ